MKARRKKKEVDIVGKEQVNVRSILYSFLDVLNIGEFPNIEKLTRQVKKRFEHIIGLSIEMSEKVMEEHMSQYKVGAKMRKLSSNLYVKEGEV